MKYTYTPIITNEPYNNFLVNELSGDEVKSSAGEVLSTRFKDALEFTPSLSLIRASQLSDSEYDQEDMYDDLYGFDTYQNEEVAITKDDWKASDNYREGLEFQDHMTESQAEILADLHDQREHRDFIMERADLNIFQKTGLFGVDLAVQALDPLNYLLAFTPVVGEARFASLVSRYGKTSARLMTGAIEGTVGNTFVEPIIYGSAQLQQSDYDITDAIYSVGLGGLFGSGLHAGLGKVSDKLGISIQAREKALQTALNQMEEGYNVKIDSIVEADINKIVDTDSLDMPKPVGYDERFNKIVDDVLELVPEDEGMQRVALDMQNETDRLYQMSKNGILDENEYTALMTEVETLKTKNDAYSEAFDAAFSCLVRK